MSKKCKDCEIEKPASDYYPSGKYLQSRCKPCHNKSRSRYYIKKGRVSKKDIELREVNKKISIDLQAGMSLKEIGEKYNDKPQNIGNRARRGKYNTETYKYIQKKYKTLK